MIYANRNPTQILDLITTSVSEERFCEIHISTPIHSYCRVGASR